MKKTFLRNMIFGSLTLLLIEVHADSSQFFMSFHNKTYVSQGNPMDQHLELVNMNATKTEATFSISDVVSLEKMTKFNWRCEMQRGANGRTELIVCLSSGSCFLSHEARDITPYVVLNRYDGNILVSYPTTGLFKLWPSTSRRYWICN